MSIDFRSFPARLATLFLAFAILAAGGALSAPPAAAQSVEISQADFDAIVEVAGATEPVYGPEEGELAHDPEIATVALSNLAVTDLVATATFQNPNAGSRQQFDYGIQFRSANSDDQATYLRFIVVSGGDWAFTSGQGEILLAGVYRALADGRDEENTLTIVATGSIAHAAINGEYVGSVEVDFLEAGDVGPGTAFFGDSFRDGAVTGYTDFTVWSLDEEEADQGNANARPNRPNTGFAKPPGGATRETADDDGGNQPDEPAGERDEPIEDEPVGTQYESPTYGYTLTYDSTWSFVDQASSDGVDTLVLTHDGSTLVAYGLPAGRTAEECRDVLIDIYADGVANSGVDATVQNANSGTIESGNRAGSSYMFVRTSIAGSTIGTTSYFECGPLNGVADYVVGIRFSGLDLLFEEQFPSVRALVGTLAEADQTQDGDGASTAHVSRGEEGRLVYVSPSFGFTVEILPGWTIEEDTVQGGYDTLVVASDSGRVTVSGFASTGTAVRCVDSIIANLTSDPSLTNVAIGVQADGSTSRWDAETTSEVVVFFTANGTNYGRYYACFSGNDGQSMLVFAYEALEEEIETGFANIEQMLDLIRVP
jgi:hypothetical protein